MSSFLCLGVVALLAMLLAGQSEGSGPREPLCLDNMGPNGPSLDAFSGKGRELSLCVREYRKKYQQDFECGKDLRGRTCVQIKDHFQSFVDDLRRCLEGPATTSATTTVVKPRDCKDLFDMGVTGDQNRQIFPDGVTPFTVRCNDSATVVLKRHTFSSIFNRTFEEYENGFENPDGDFYIGNKVLSLLTSALDYQLMVNVTRPNDTEQHAVYTTFQVGPTSDLYRLTVGGYSGDAGDGLQFNNDKRFVTYDKTDEAAAENARTFNGGFWFTAATTLNYALVTISSGGQVNTLAWGNDFRSAIKAATWRLERI